MYVGTELYQIDVFRVVALQQVVNQNSTNKQTNKQVNCERKSLVWIFKVKGDWTVV